MDRDGKMGVHLDGSRGVGVSRLKVIEGPSGRRRRTKAERARIAAESMMPGVTVADTARKHSTTRWQIYDWRELLRKGNLVVPESMRPCRSSRNWWSMTARPRHRWRLPGPISRSLSAMSYFVLALVPMRAR